ncbi:hypothetical protein SI65_08566 [Aspergillus cristatus]|uniref:nitrilase n=1 Tax=Aspergillus cristatus TaxID=573508 RepID=A0A1E3B5A3_ASPCR|nr:hypothetical protein SI65_08566 [Aspergillus cristatus]
MFFSKVVVAATASAGLAAAVSNSTATATLGNITVAMVRSAPPNWPSPLLNYDWTDSVLNISETVDAGISLIKKAAQDGAGIITFPELWFPGFPKGNAENNWTVHYLSNYIHNSLTIGSPNWNRLIEAIKEAGIYAGLAYSELKGDNIFMSQTLISPLGDILAHRHKV